MDNGINFGVNAAGVPLQPMNYGHRADLAKLIRLGLLGAGAGTLFRVGKAVRDTIGQPESKPSPYQSRPIDVTIPEKTAGIKVVPKGPAAVSMAPSMAAPVPPPPAPPVPTPAAVAPSAGTPTPPGIVTQLAESLGNMTGLFSPGDKARSGMEGFFKSDQATNPSGKVWFNALAAPLAIGTATAGYKLTDWLADKQRENRLDEDLDDAKGEYESSLTGGRKVAGAIDQLFAAAQEKQATWGDTARQGVGLYGALALLLGTGAGALTYNWGKSNSQSQLLQSAIKRREQDRFATSPPPLMAVPRETAAATSAG